MDLDPIQIRLRVTEEYLDRAKIIVQIEIERPGSKWRWPIGSGYLMETTGTINRFQLKKILTHNKGFSIHWLLIILITIICWGWGIYQSGLAFPDEAVHLMDGVFIRDALSDIPLLNPIKWAKAYYYQYPAVTFFAYYPPAFSIVEGFMFQLFGVSEEIGRMTVLLLGLLAVSSLFLIIRKYIGEIPSVFACILIATQPTIAYWARQTMLEVPTISMGILSIGFLLWYLKNRKLITLLTWIFLGIATIFTKQNAIFILISYLILICFYGRRFIFKDKKPWLGWVIIAIPTSIFVYWDATFVPMHQLANLDPSMNPNVFYRLICNIKLIGSHFNVLGIAAIVGIIVAIYSRRWNSIVLGGSWALPLLITTMAIPRTDARFLILLTPALAIFASAILANGINKGRLFRVLLVTLSLVFISIHIYQVSKVEVEYLVGQEVMAKEAISSTRSNHIFYDGHFDTGFIFFVRKNDPCRLKSVYRGSKVLYSAVVFKDFHVKNLVETEEEIYDLLTKLKVDPIIVEETEKEMTKPSIMLRSLLEKPEFHKSYETLLSKKNHVLSKLSAFRLSNLYDGEPYHPSLPMPGLGRSIDPPSK
jgi:hypothetical protein